MAEGAFWTAKRFEHTLTQPWQNSGIADVTQDPYIVRHFGEFWVELEAARVLTNRAAESLQAAWELQEAVTPVQRSAVAIDIATAKIAATRAGLRITSEIFESTETQPELLPCAHCGGPAILEHNATTARWAVYCKGIYCGICTPLCSTPAWAVKYWNRRDWANPSRGE